MDTIQLNLVSSCKGILGNLCIIKKQRWSNGSWVGPLVLDYEIQIQTSPGDHIGENMIISMKKVRTQDRKRKVVLVYQ